MKTALIFIFILSFNLIVRSQNVIKPNSLIFSAGYQTNLKNNSITINLNYRFKLIFNKRINLLTIGTGVNVLTKDLIFYNLKINLALNQGYISYFCCGAERYSKWFIGGQYNFTDSFNSQFISPELGYNIRLLPRLHFTPKFLYNISITKNQMRWSENIFVNFAVRYLFSNLNIGIRKKGEEVRAIF